jgi:hypothetical protein
MGIDILRPDMGVQTIMDLQGPASGLPEARTLVSDTTGLDSLTNLYRLPTLRQLLAATLSPKLVDEKLTRPDVFNRNLRSAYNKLKDEKKAEVRHFVRNDLQPLIDDADLLRTFSDLLVGG